MYKTTLIILFLVSLSASCYGFYESCKRKNAFGLTPYLFWLGIFVWGDAVTFGLFWATVFGIFSIYHNLNLLLLVIGLFWFVRSVGETFYWINQQFSAINRNPPGKLFGSNFFKNDSIWFIYQTFWQCITVISLLAIIILLKVY